MAIEIVDFPIKNGGSFHSHVKLPEGIYNIHHAKKNGVFPYLATNITRFIM
jgi:hypothetical protein